MNPRPKLKNLNYKILRIKCRGKLWPRIWWWFLKYDTKSQKSEINWMALKKKAFVFQMTSLKKYKDDRHIGRNFYIGKVFQIIYLIKKKIVSKIYKELLQLNKRQILKWAKDLSRHFSKWPISIWEDAQRPQPSRGQRS